ncbi:MAG: hypothetical protein KatS3mg115_1973 [Candidatus Poribacteria bacterium]|nr:MAG: hypothetical protein KatS3mg115_1973 [Candidatus Poribacteria bacterium]
MVGLRVREPLIASGLPLTLEVTLRNYGDAPVRDRRLRIQVGEAVRASRSVDLPPNAEVTETFPLTFDVAGLHLVAATLDPDRFPEDDRLIEVVSVLGQVDALIVGSHPQFLRLALDPYRLETPQIAYTIRAGALRPEESRQRELDRPDLLIVQDPDFSDDRLLAALRNRLLQGGPVILFLGERSARTRPPEWMGIAFLEERAFDPPLGIRPVHLSADGSLLPPWPESALDGAAARALWGIFQADFWARPTAPHVRRAVVPFPSPDSSLRVLALLENGAPLVVAGDLQEGRFFLVGLPAEGEDWSDLPVHPAFVPMMQQLALLAVSPVRQPTRTLRTGAPYRLPAAPEDPQSAEVVRPDGTTATVGRTEDGSAFVYTDTTALGVYQVRLGERNELFAVRLPPEEGDLRPLEPQEVTAAFGGSALWWGDASERGREPNQELRRNGVELWGFFVLLGIGLLVVDSLLSNRRLPETAES